MKSELLRWAFPLTLFLCFASTGLAVADGQVILEGVSREHCSAFSDPNAAVPSKVVLEQAIVGDDQLPSPFGIYALSEYRGQEGVNRGKMIVRSRLVKRNGTIIQLPTLKAQVGDRGAFADDRIAETFEKGDLIRWVAKLKRHPPIFFCWRLEMGIETGGPTAP